MIGTTLFDLRRRGLVGRLRMAGTKGTKFSAIRSHLERSDADGFFSGQNGYGYRSIEAFVQATDSVRCGRAEPQDFHGKLATARDTLLVTAILEAGRRSLDEHGRAVRIDYTANGEFSGLSVATVCDC